MIPIVPFEAESVSFTEYHQKIRRFQEIAFQIARARNEKRIENRKKEMDIHEIKKLTRRKTESLRVPMSNLYSLNLTVIQGIKSSYCR